MKEATPHRCVLDFQIAVQCWQKSDEATFLTLFMDQADHGDLEERRVTRGAISELCREATINDEELSTTEDIRTTLERYDTPAQEPNGIRYKDIYQLADDDIGKLTNEFNASLRGVEIRVEWLDRYLMSPPKPNKGLCSIGIYLIITRQNTTGKLLENILAGRLTDELERRHIFPSTLGGYREGNESLV